MKSPYRRARAIARIVVVVIGAVTVSQALAEERSWVLHERTLPVPAAASEAIRDSIAKAPQPDVARSQGITFQTNEEWVKFIRAADEAAVATIKPLAERLKVTIEEEKIAGVTVYRVTPANINPANKNRLFVHTHGGAYSVGAIIRDAN